MFKCTLAAGLLTLSNIFKSVIKGTLAFGTFLQVCYFVCDVFSCPFALKFFDMRVPLIHVTRQQQMNCVLLKNIYIFVESQTKI